MWYWAQLDTKNAKQRKLNKIDGGLKMGKLLLIGSDFKRVVKKLKLVI